MAGSTTADDQQTTEAPVGGCCHCATPAAGGGKTARDTYPWWKLGVGLVVAGQTMIFGLGLNNAVHAGDGPAVYSPVYWGLHGILLTSALVVVVLLGPPLFRNQWLALRRREITVEGLFLLSLIGALGGSLVSTITGTGSVYYEVVAIVLAVYTLGKRIGEQSRERVMHEVSQLRDSFDWAWVRTESGNRMRMPVAELCTRTSQVVVMPGEGVPVDGVVEEGESFVTETSLTGEPTPVVKRVGDEVLAGTHAVDGQLVVRPSALKGERQMDRIFETVEEARRKPSALQREADRLMRWFLPIVVTVAVGTFAGWLLIGGALWWEALFNSMAVLLVACPCALGLATPIAVWGGLLKLSTLGIVARNGTVVDALAQAKVFVFDKTGTLSDEKLRVVDFVAAGENGTRREWLKCAVASLERDQSHPVAQALAELSANGVSVQGLSLVPGRGVRGSIDSRQVSVGELELMEPGNRAALQELAARSPAAADGPLKRVFVEVDGAPAGVALLSEKLRERTEEVVQELGSEGIRSEICTGDPSPRWQQIGGVELRHGCSPEQKAGLVEELRRSGSGAIIFVGDGVNDAGAMACSDAAIAMGQGAALAQSTADAVLMGQSLAPIPEAVRVSRKVMRSVAGNIRFAATYNAIGMSLAAAGILHPVVAALLMVGSSAVVSTRALRAAK